MEKVRLKTTLWGRDGSPRNCRGMILHFAALSRLISKIERAVDLGFGTNGFPISRI
jgi:hypothetical protein